MEGEEADLNELVLLEPVLVLWLNFQFMFKASQVDILAEFLEDLHF